VTGGPAVLVAAAVPGPVTIVIRDSASLGGPSSDRPEADCQWPGPGAAAPGRGRLGSLVMVAEPEESLISSRFGEKGVKTLSDEFSGTSSSLISQLDFLLTRRPHREPLPCSASPSLKFTGKLQVQGALTDRSLVPISCSPSGGWQYQAEVCLRPRPSRQRLTQTRPGHCLSQSQSHYDSPSIYLNTFHPRRVTVTDMSQCSTLCHAQ
jgi:hypothetical protein